MWELHLACFFFYAKVDSRSPQSHLMSVNEMTQHSTYINNNKLKSPFPFSLWFKSIISNLPPTSSLDDLVAHAKFNYLSSEYAFYVPTFIFLCTSSSCSEKLSCHRCPFIYSPQPHIEFLVIFQGSDQISLLFVAFSDHSSQKSLSLNVYIFSNHCLHVALNHVLSHIVFIMYLDSLFPRF